MKNCANTIKSIQRHGIDHRRMKPTISLANLQRLRSANGVLAFGLPFYWAASYTGPYCLISEWQFSLFDDYLGFLSYALCLILLLLPSIVLTRSINVLATDGMTDEQINQYYKKTVIGDMDRSRAFKRRLYANIGLLLASTVIACALLGGGYFLGMAQYADAPSTLPIESLFGEQAPPSRYVLTSAYPDFNAALLVETKTRSSTLGTYYLPLSAEPAPEARQPIRVVLKVYGRWRYDALKETPAARLPIQLSGMLFTPIDNFVRLRFEQRGATLAQHHWVLDDSAAPGWYRDFGNAVLLWLGGFGVTWLLAIVAFRRWRGKKLIA